MGIIQSVLNQALGTVGIATKLVKPELQKKAEEKKKVEETKKSELIEKQKEALKKAAEKQESQRQQKENYNKFVQMFTEGGKYK